MLNKHLYQYSEFSEFGNMFVDDNEERKRLEIVLVQGETYPIKASLPGSCFVCGEKIPSLT